MSPSGHPRKLAVALTLFALTAASAFAAGGPAGSTRRGGASASGASGGMRVVATGGGSVLIDDSHSTFGFEVGFRGESPDGHLNFQNHGDSSHLISTEIVSLQLVGTNKVDFSGHGEQDGASKDFCVHAEDNGEPGVGSDIFKIRIVATGAACSPTKGGVLTGGNIQVNAGAPPGGGGGKPDQSPILAGAAKVNITPFTLTSEMLACRADQTCPYHDTLALSNPEVSNPDGLPGGLFQTIGQEMADSSASTTWIGPAGIWGEEFVDENSNGRYDSGEPFSDDPANSSPTPGPGYPGPLGDPVSSANKWDGIYIAGYGGDRVALGAFDPLWARVLFLRDTRTGLSVAWVSLDLLGYFSDFVDRIRARLAALLDVDQIILTHTHDHESPDTHVGIWGADTFSDGTYPRYEIYVEAKIAQAITEAARKLSPARFRFGSILPGTKFGTPNGNLEDLEGMQSRNSCRTPWFFDDELRVMQVATDPPGRETIATLMNWGTHVESMDGRNKYLSSDFPHTARQVLESQLGGIAMYTPGAQGAGEIVGDSCTRRWHRDSFDGQTFPVDAGGDPLAFQDPYDNRVPRDRTYAIGRVLGAAAVAALQSQPFDPPKVPFEFFGPKVLCFPVNNEALFALAAIGVIDKPLVNPDCLSQAGSPPDRATTALYAFRIGSGSFLTAPGELFPELYYGIVNINRATFDPLLSGYEYVSPNPSALSCSARSHHGSEQPGGHSDRPFEPAIREAQKASFGTKVNFLIGYTPDLLGYIVPGYDFYWYGLPAGFGLGAAIDQVPDPCSAQSPDLAFPNARYGSHYQETNSAGSMLGPAIACELVRLIGDPLDEATGDPLAAGPRRACFEWDFANLTGRPPDQPPPFEREPGCPLVPLSEDELTACEVRHY